jgi:hypothetical protein
MSLVRKAASALGGIFLAVLLIAALAPKATHGLVAALVQVANTAADPVPNKDVDNPGRATIVQVSCAAVSTTTSFGTIACFGGNTGSGGYSVPAGQRLVVQQLDGNCITPKGNTVTSAIALFEQSGLNTYPNMVLTSEGDQSGQTFYAFNEPVHYYADSGSGFYFSASISDNTGNTSCNFNLTGYLMSYP